MENRLSRDQMWCAAESYHHTCQICAKGILESNFNQAVIDKISNFHEIAPNFTFLPKLLLKLLLPYQYYDRDMTWYDGNLLFQVCRFEPLIMFNVYLFIYFCFVFCLAFVCLFVCLFL